MHNRVFAFDFELVEGPQLRMVSHAGVVLASGAASTFDAAGRGARLIWGNAAGGAAGNVKHG